MSEGRPHLRVQVPPIAGEPLDGGGVRELLCLEARTRGRVEHRARVRVLAPVLEDGRAPRWPSLVLAHPPDFELVPDPPRPLPARFESDGATVRAQVPLAGARYFGGGLQVAPLALDGRRLVLWNTDAWCYGRETPSLYQSHPWILALLPGGRALGVLADTPRRGQILCARDGLELQFERDPFDLYLIEAEHPREVLRALAALVGSAEPPPLWALGYHQCRWSYGSAEEVREIARAMRDRRIPCDALWLDIDYMDRRRVFTWDGEVFPEPRALVGELHAAHLRCVAIVDPGIAVAEGYEPYESGLAGDHFVHDAAGRPVQGRVWPGISCFPDFTREATRAWWAERVASLVAATGIDGIWNDMNEPAVQRAPTGSLPEDAVHRGLGGGPHALFHNLYGQLMLEASREGLLRARPGRRPFVLTRAAHLAAARHGATWTGDNQARWEDLEWAIPMVLNLGLSGQPFAGPDLGGFYGDPSPELFVRWFDLGAYLPFCRGHSETTSRRKEPWSFGPEVEALVRGALERRMRLLPTLYTLFHRSLAQGLPVARPLFLADPADQGLGDVDDQLLLGDDLLVAPVVREGERARSVRLPGGAEWYAFPAGGPRLPPGTVDAPAPLGTTPVFARAGAIVVEGATREHTAAPDELRTLHVFLDARGEALGELYEDAGDGPLAPPPPHRLHRFHARAAHGRFQLEVESEGALLEPTRRRILRVHGLDGRAEPWRHEDAGMAAIEISL